MPDPSLPSASPLSASQPSPAAKARSLLNDLSPSEARLAQVLVQQPETVLEATAQDWANSAGVSTASVVRFCRTLGFTGLPELRLCLAAELSQRVTPSPAWGLASWGLAQQILEANSRALQETVTLLDTGAIDRAAQTIAQAEAIEFFALGLSSPIALDAAHRFQRLGFPASYVADSHMQAVRAASLSRHSVAFAISHSGRTPEVLAATQVAGRAGATAVALTSAPRSALARSADIALIAATSESQIRAESMSSRIAHLAIIDILCAALMELRPQETAAALQRSREAEARLLRR